MSHVVFQRLFTTPSKKISEAFTALAACLTCIFACNPFNTDDPNQSKLTGTGRFTGLPRKLQPLVFCFCLSLIFLGAQPLQAEKLFVSQSANASDDNPGTRQLPLETIAEGIARAVAGDLVIVLPGDYRGEDTGFGSGVIPVISKTGDPGNPISIIGKHHAKVGSFIVQDSSHITISGFRIAGSDFFKQDNWQKMPAIVRDIPADQLPDIDFTGDFEDRRNVIEPAFATYFSIIDDLGFTTGIDVLSSSHIKLSRNKITGFWSGIQCRDASNILIAKNVIAHNVNGIFTFEPEPALSDSFIIDNYVSQSLDTGIFIRRGSTNVRVLRNFVSFSGINHISLAEGCTDCRVSWNLASLGGFYSETMQFPGSSAISLNDCGVGNDVSFNVALRQIDLTGIDGNGIILDFMRPDAAARVRWNYAFLNMGSGLNLTASPGSRIHWNVFSKNGFLSTSFQNGAGIKLSREQDVDNRIAHNLLFLNFEAGIISSETLQLQRLVDFNTYVTRFPAPLAWDSFFVGQASYETLEEMQTATGWESNGRAAVLND